MLTVQLIPWFASVCYISVPG